MLHGNSVWPLRCCAVTVCLYSCVLNQMFSSRIPDGFMHLAVSFAVQARTLDDVAMYRQLPHAWGAVLAGSQVLAGVIITW